MFFGAKVLVFDRDDCFANTCIDSLESETVHVKRVYTIRELSHELAQMHVGCVVAELEMPELIGIQIATNLRQMQSPIPVIVATNNGDVSSCSRAFKSGVVDFLVKPVSAGELRSKVEDALSISHERYNHISASQELSHRLLLLTQRELEVVRFLVVGRSMKEIAKESGTTFQSVARHRQRVLIKLGVENDVALANLLREVTIPIRSRQTQVDSLLTSVHD